MTTTETRSERPEIQELDADRVAASILEVLTAKNMQLFYEKSSVKRTPLQEWGSGIHGCRVLEKREDLQNVNSFKIRGASMALLLAQKRNPALRRAVTASAGNHAQGVGDAANQLGLDTTVHAKNTISFVKAARIKSQGSELIAAHATIEEALTTAWLDAENDDFAEFIHPFDNPEVIAGQATITYETLDQLREQGIDLLLDNVNIVVPVGGGGLLAGIATVVHDCKQAGLVGDNVKVYGAQMENCDAMTRAITYDRLDDLFTTDALDDSCDGTAVLKPGCNTFAIARDKAYIEDILTASKGAVGEAMHDQYIRYGVHVEPAAAVSHAIIDQLSLAAGLVRKQPIFVGIVSGSNTSSETWGTFNRAALAEQQRTPEEPYFDPKGDCNGLGHSAVWRSVTFALKGGPAVAAGEKPLLADLEEFRRQNA